MSLIYKLLHEFISQLKQKQHPLVLLNGLFHDTVNISYKHIEQALEKRTEALAKVSTHEIDKINEIYTYYVQDVAALREALNQNQLPGVSEANKTYYLQELDKVAKILEQGSSVFDRRQAVVFSGKIFSDVLYNISHDAAWAQYQKRYLDGAEQQLAENPSYVAQQIIGILRNVQISLEPVTPEKDALIRLIAQIQEWQQLYEALPLEDAALITRELNDIVETNPGLLNNRAPVKMRPFSENKTAATFEYRLADLYLFLQQKTLEIAPLEQEAAAASAAAEFEKFDLSFRAIQSENHHYEDDTDNESNVEDGELEPDQLGLGFEGHSDNPVNFKYLSKHLHGALHDTDIDEKIVCYVCPVTDLSNAEIEELPGLTARSYGYINFMQQDDDFSETASLMSAVTDNFGMSRNDTEVSPRNVEYTEYVDSAGKIALINNRILGELSSLEMNKVLMEQSNYLKHAENKTNLADDFVFRLEFKSQQQFDEYQQSGRLGRMLKDFADQNTDFKIKVVIKGPDAQKETIKRYASFNELFDTAQSSLKKKVPLIAGVRSGSQLNVRPQQMRQGPPRVK